jgi:hypothetical protein
MCKPPCQYNANIFSDDPLCKPPCQYNTNIFADDPMCVPPCEPGSLEPRCQKPCDWNPSILSNDPMCKPPCQYNANIFSDDPMCKPPCEYNANIFADDVMCKPPCQYNDKIFADDAMCKPPCQYDASIFADDPFCRPPCPEGLIYNDAGVCMMKDPIELTTGCTNFTVTNLNPFAVNYSYVIGSGGPGGTGSLEVGEAETIETGYYPGLVVVYVEGFKDPMDAHLMKSGEVCQKHTTETPPVKTKTPRIVRQQTPEPPPVVGEPDILIPVTGADFGTTLPLNSIFFSLSIGFIGLGLVLNGSARERKEEEI